MEGAGGVPERSAGMSVSGTRNVAGAVPKVMSVALIEPFDRWFLSLSKGSGTTRRNDCYTKCGGFDKLNHRNANLLDSLFKAQECLTWKSEKNWKRVFEEFAQLQAGTRV